MQKSNGKKIENEYKRPNLSNLVKKKNNNQLQGSTFRAHKKDSKIVGVCQTEVQTVVAEPETVLESENIESQSSQFGGIVNLILLEEFKNLFKDLYSLKKNCSKHANC